MHENLKKMFLLGVAALVVALVVPLAAMPASRSTATSFTFGRIGGNIQPFTVTVAADGSVTATGPAPSHKDMVTATALARVTRAVVAQQFFSLPRSLSCPKTLPDFASRFVTVHMHGASRRVLVRGDCSRRFSALYATVAGAVGIG